MRNVQGFLAFAWLNQLIFFEHLFGLCEFSILHRASARSVSRLKFKALENLEIGTVKRLRSQLPPNKFGSLLCLMKLL
jgi:hypothetical protein